MEFFSSSISGRIASALLSVGLIASIITQPAIANTPVKNPPCPVVSNQLSGVKVLGFEFDGTRSTHLRVNQSDSSAVTSPQDLIGCYQTTEIVTRYQDALWQVGVIDRDAAGFFWKNAAGIVWRLTLDADQLGMTTGADNPYYQHGKKFTFINLPSGEVGKCKIRNARGNFGAGFTAEPTRYFGKTEVIFKVIVPKFRDEPKPHSPQKTIFSLGLDKVEDFWNRSSYGRMKLSLQPELNITVPGKAADYDDGPGAGDSKTNRLMSLAFKAYMEANVTSNFDGLIFALPIELDNYHAGYALSLADLTNDRSLAKIGVTYVGSSPSRWGDPNAPPWKVLAHELGHNFGLPDYYITSRSDRGYMEWAGLTPGPFDIMAHLDSVGNEILAWNRWKLGWLKDDEVECIESPSQSKLIPISPVASQPSGVKAVIFPQDVFSAIVVESRQAIGSDQRLLSDETGLLVYTVNSRIGTGDGPIRIVPRVNMYTGTTWSPALSDKVRHRKAALQPGDRIKVGDLTLENVGKAGYDKLLVFKGPDARQEAVVSSQLKINYALSLQSIPALIKSTSDAPIFLTSENPEICRIIGTKIQLRKAGVCRIHHEQEANDRYFSASQVFSFDVLPNKTIKCQKGYTVRKVIGTNPKCPKGFRQTP